MQFLCHKVTKLFAHKATKSSDQKRTTNGIWISNAGQLAKM